jgi:hypothetical protein
VAIAHLPTKVIARRGFLAARRRGMPPFRMNITARDRGALAPVLLDAQRRSVL